MKHLFFLIIFMATQFGCYAQCNPKIDSLYAYLRARKLVGPYTLDNTSPWGLRKQFTAIYVLSNKPYQPNGSKTDSNMHKRWTDEFYAFKEIRKTLIELTDEAAESYSYEYHQDDADTIITNMALKSNSNCPINTWKSPRENVALIATAPEIISFRYNNVRGNTALRLLQFRYDGIVDSTKSGKTCFDIQSLKKKITPIFKDKSIKRRTMVCRYDSTFNISEYQNKVPTEERFSSTSYASSIKYSENNFTIYKFNDEERAKTVLHQLMSCVRKHIDEHPDQTYRLSSEDIFREGIVKDLFTGLRRFYLMVNDDESALEKENCQFSIYACRDLEGFYIITNDCKGNLLVPVEWKTLKEFNNGKKTYYKDKL